MIRPFQPGEERHAAILHHEGVLGQASDLLDQPPFDLDQSPLVGTGGGKDIGRCPVLRWFGHAGFHHAKKSVGQHGTPLESIPTSNHIHYIPVANAARGGTLHPQTSVFHLHEKAEPGLM
ncbi:MAG: hypothetical protein FJ405_17545, partial [Verrucomicrobia bacterium]|nr:hypothetical protein [Verrucomicrobiota bacterium]